MVQRACDEQREPSMEDKVFNALMVAKKKIREIKELAEERGYEDILKIVNQ